MKVPNFLIGMLMGLVLAGGGWLLMHFGDSAQSWQNVSLPDVTEADLISPIRASRDKSDLLNRLNSMSKDEAMDQIQQLNANSIKNMSDRDCLRLLAGLSSDEEIDAMWHTILRLRYQDDPESCVRLIHAAAKSQYGEKELEYVLADLAKEVDGNDASGVLLRAGASVSWTKRIIVDGSGRALPWLETVDRFFGGKWSKEAFHTAASFLTRELSDPSDELSNCIDSREFLQRLSGRMDESSVTIGEQVEISRMIARSRQSGLFSDWMENISDGYRRNRIIGESMKSWVMSGSQGADERDQTITRNILESGDLARKLIVNIATGRAMANGEDALRWAVGVEDAESRNLAVDAVIRGQAGYAGAGASLLSAIAYYEAGSGGEASWQIVERVAQIESERLRHELSSDRRALEAIRQKAGEIWPRLAASLNANGIETSQ